PLKGRGPMFDELQRLREVPGLLRLLTHYADAGAADHEAWQDRLMELAEVAPRDLVTLHGELIAHGWVEQNTGVTPHAQPGRVAGCYRVTPAGLRALRRAQSLADDDEHEALA